MKPFKLFIPFIPGFEQISLNEINKLGLNIDSYDKYGCYLTGHWKHIFILNDYAKTINRVYIRLIEFKALSFSELYNKLTTLDFSDYLTSANLCIRVNSFKSKLFHENAIQQLFLKFIHNTYPDYKFTLQGSPDFPDTQMFMLNFSHDVLTISVDTTGVPLYKRSYLEYRAEAPLRENIAAAMFNCLNDYQYNTLIDPFCGSGTIPLEFIMNERKASNALFRSFIYKKWKSYDDNYYQKTLVEPPNANKINYIAYDLDPNCVEITRKNYEIIKNEESIIIDQNDFFSLIPDTFDDKSIIVCNPPWGKRLDQAPVTAILQRLAEFAEYLPVFCIIPKDNLRYFKKYEIIFSTNSGSIKVVFIKLKK